MAWRTFLPHPVRLSILLAVVVGLIAAGCGGGSDGGSAEPATTEPPAATEEPAATGEPAETGGSATTEAAAAEVEPATVHLALDWTPNTNHTGFFVAKNKGYYADEGITMEVLPYSGTAPDTLVGNGKAECGIGFEDFMTIAVATGAPEKAVYAILQKNPTALIVRADSKFQSPKDLDGATYGGFGLPGEEAILKTMIQYDGGQGTFKNVTLDTAAYEAVYSEKVDFAAAYQTWETIEARLRGIDLREFRQDEYGIPEYYAIILMCNTDWLAENPDVAKRFIAATVKGWEFANSNPEEAGQILIDENPEELPNTELVMESAKTMASDGYLANSAGQVGCMTLQQWTDYPQFLYDNGILVDADGNPLSAPPDFASLFTNEFLPYECE